MTRAGVDAELDRHGRAHGRAGALDREPAVVRPPVLGSAPREGGVDTLHVEIAHNGGAGPVRAPRPKAPAEVGCRILAVARRAHPARVDVEAPRDPGGPEGRKGRLGGDGDTVGHGFSGVRLDLVRVRLAGQRARVRVGRRRARQARKVRGVPVDGEAVDTAVGRGSPGERNLERCCLGLEVRGRQRGSLLLLLAGGRPRPGRRCVLAAAACACGREQRDDQDTDQHGWTPSHSGPRYEPALKARSI
jgi:hypothetical protein